MVCRLPFAHCETGTVKRPLLQTGDSKNLSSANGCGPTEGRIYPAPDPRPPRPPVPPSPSLFLLAPKRLLTCCTYLNFAMATPDFRAGARTYFAGIPPSRWDYSVFSQHCYKLPSFPRSAPTRKAFCRELWDSCLEELLTNSPNAEAMEPSASATLPVSTPSPHREAPILPVCVRGVI